MTRDHGLAIAEAYRWQRRLGNLVIDGPGCEIVADPDHPNVWDANHADAVTAKTEAEIDAVFAAMNQHLGHSDYRVVHTDGYTPDAFLARLALEDYEERPTTIQMALLGKMNDRGPPIVTRPIVEPADWDALLALVLRDHAEGRKSGDLQHPPEFSAQMVATARAKSPDFRYHLVIENGEAIAYGAYAAAPGRVGMIEDLFTLPSARRRGVATALMAMFVDQLRDAGCEIVFLGALASEAPKHLYRRLGFQPVGLARCWVKRVAAG